MDSTSEVRPDLDALEAELKEPRYFVDDDGCEWGGERLEGDQLVLDIIAYTKRLEQENARLRKALEFYADEGNWDGPVEALFEGLTIGDSEADIDGGMIARDALGYYAAPAPEPEQIACDECGKLWPVNEMRHGYAAGCETYQCPEGCK